MPTDPEFALRYITDAVLDRYTNDQTQHEPMVFAFRDGAVETIIQLNFDDEYSKTMSVKEADGILTEMNADCSVFVSEGWVSQYPKGSELMVRPSLDPKRMEVLVVEVSAPKRHLGAIYEMKRRAGKLVELDEMQHTDSQATGVTVSSKFDFFNNRPHGNSVH